MKFRSNAEIISFLNEKPGRMRSFLREIPTKLHQEALQYHQKQVDTHYFNSNLQNTHTYNVLDLPLSNVINACKYEGLISEFTYDEPFSQIRLKDHSYYGLKLVNKFPEKYYVGAKSHHYNRSRQIQEFYGIYNNQTGQQEGELYSKNQRQETYAKKYESQDQQNEASFIDDNDLQQSFIDDSEEYGFQYIESSPQQINKLDQQSGQDQQVQAKEKGKSKKINKQQIKPKLTKEKSKAQRKTRTTNQIQQETKEDLQLILESYSVQAPKEEQKIYLKQRQQKAQSSRKNSKWLVQSDSD